MQPVKPLTKDGISTYVNRTVPMKRIHFDREFRAPFFSVLRKILENPLEELITTQVPTMDEINSSTDGLLLM